MKSKCKICRLLFAALLAITLAACGGGSGGDGGIAEAPVTTTQPPVTISNNTLVTGTVSKGPLQASQVNLFPIDVFGAITGAAIASTVTDANGNFVVSIPAGTGALIIRAGGGSYIDESDREPDPQLKRRIVLADDEGLESLLPPGLSSVTVSVVTQALLDKTRRETQGPTFLTQFQANRDMATAAFGFDPLTTAPTNPVSPSASATVQQRQYAMLLGGLANLINRITVESGFAAPTIEIILSVSDDLSDGRIDGMIVDTPVQVACEDIDAFSLNDEIARFQNNNFDAYATTPLLVVNETVFGNAAPTAVDDQFDVANGESLQVAAPGVLENDLDADGDVITAQLVTGPEFASTFSLQANGSFTYTHDGSGGGTDSFTYIANDGLADSDIATVTLTIISPILTLTGTVEDQIPLSSIVAVIDSSASGGGTVAVPTTADANGNYSVTFSSSTNSDFVSLTATGAGDDDDIILRSLVGSVAMLQAVAGPDGVVNSTELPAVDISYLSTSLAVLAEEESSAPINSDAGFAEASAAVDSSSLIRVAASLKTALDVDIAIGLETDTTLTILANTPLRKDVTEMLETEFPDQLTNATAEIATDSRRPYLMADVPSGIYITAHGNLAFGGLAANLQFNPDGSGTYQGFNGATETSWTVNQVGHIVVTFLTPFVSEAFFDVDGNGTQDRQVTTFDRTTLQRFETGNVADHVFVLDHRILTYPEDPSIPTEELNGDTGPETARLAVSQVIPFTAGDLSGQALTASFYHQENNAIPNSPPEFGFDTLDFNPDGTGSSRRRQLAFSWSIDTTGVLSVVFASGDENDFIGLLPEDDGVLNAILTATQASGDAFTSRSFVVSRDETLGFNASNLENIRYRSVATTDRTLNQSGLSVFDFEFSPGGDACRVPGSGASEWSWLSANNRVEISRTSIFDGSLVSYRTWQPLRLIENRYWVIETLEFSDVPTDANTTPGRAAIYSMQQSLEGNTRPVANDDNVFGDTNEPTYVLLTSLVANDIDADGDEIILAANDSTSANGGTVTQLTSPGGRVAGLKYIPPPGFVGTDTFTYGITDLFCQSGAVSNATVTVDVTLPDNVYLVNRQVGAGGVTGFIETNGTIGPLAQADIVSFDLTVSDGVDSFNLSPANGSEFILFANDPGMFTADQSTIFFDSTLLGAGQDGIEFRSEPVPGDTRSAEWFLGEAGDPLEVIFHSDLDVPFNHSQEADCLDDLVALAEVTPNSSNSSPCATDDQFELFDGGTLNISAPGVLLNDTDNNGNALTATLVTAPASATAFNLEPDGSFTYTHDGSGAGTVSFEYEVNDGTSTSNLATVTLTINEFSFTIGEVGPGGGPVFYLDPTTIDPATGRGTAGLEAAPADLENPNNPGASDFSLPWGCSGTTAGATAEAIGVGAVNTQTIVDAACSNAGNEAAEAAAAFQGGGFSDWFLPSIDELNEMYLNIGQGGDGLNEGGFGNNLYWSSSEIDNNLAWELNFVNGVLFGNDKNNSIRARAVRVFGNPSMAGSFALEEMGPGGGLVFYLEPSEVVLGSVPLRSTAGLEASPADLENPTNPGVFVMGWGCLGTATGATDEGIGTGAANTQIIVDDACSSVGNEAAEAANAYSNNGFNDWFLPSKDELNEMWFNIGQGGDGANEGNFINDIWWSSSEVDDSLAWRQFFASGGQDGGPKGGGRRVRAVRAFGLPPPPTFAVGDVGPGGGLVFFIEPGSDGTAGLEAAPTDLVNPLNMGGGMPWGCFNTVTAATNEGIGFGASNTAIIVADACSTTGEEAAEVAIAYVSPNLLEDWFLPSIDELNEMHSKIGQGCNVPADCSVSNPGGFTNNFYWSSTEITSQIAWVYNFNDGIMTQLSKNNNAIPVRAIRAFGTTRSLNVVAVTEIAGGGANEMDDNFLTVTQVSGALQ